MKNDGEITVKEGEEAKDIEIEVTMPPSFICTERGDPGTQCRLKVEYEIEKHSERKCRRMNGKFLVQAVMGWKGQQLEEAFCGLYVTSQTWNNELALTIKARVGLKLFIFYEENFYYFQ